MSRTGHAPCLSSLFAAPLALLVMGVGGGPSALPRVEPHPPDFVAPHVLDALARSNRVSDATRAGAHQARAGSRPLPPLPASIGPDAPAPQRARNRHVHHAHSDLTLPGAGARFEGESPTGDRTVDESYDGLGVAHTFFEQVFGRRSIDGAGMDVVATVHFGQAYLNAFWNGQQLVFGDGDGVYLRNFAGAVDVLGHEYAHGVIGTRLDYEGQAGALNESIADVFGVMLKQFMLHQNAAEADWLIGAGVLGPAVKGLALRSMRAPGTAYDDVVLGKDPQPADMAHFVTVPLTVDGGGVHINSGIPNRAFFLVATALGGHSWERAGKIWYAALDDQRLSRTATFEQFAGLTSINAEQLFGPEVRDVVIHAWGAVGVSALAPTSQAKPGGLAPAVVTAPNPPR